MQSRALSLAMSGEQVSVTRAPWPAFLRPSSPYVDDVPGPQLADCKIRKASADQLACVLSAWSHEGRIVFLPICRLILTMSRVEPYDLSSNRSNVFPRLSHLTRKRLEDKKAQGTTRPSLLSLFPFLLLLQSLILILLVFRSIPAEPEPVFSICRGPCGCGDCSHQRRIVECMRGPAGLEHAVHVGVTHPRSMACVCSPLKQVEAWQALV